MDREENKNLVETAYNMILDRITRFSLSPGSSISDYSLSKELGISRTPIREALLRLVDDGLLERMPHNFRVTDITADEIRDLYDARNGLEISMLRLSLAKGISADNLNVLRNLNASLDKCVEEGDIIRSLEYDAKIHRYLAELSENSRLLSFYDRISKQTQRMSVFSIAQSKQQANNEHEELFKAIENNDSDKAVKALSDNVLRAKDQHIHVLENSMREGWIGIAKFVYRPSSINL